MKIKPKRKYTRRIKSNAVPIKMGRRRYKSVAALMKGEKIPIRMQKQVQKMQREIELGMDFQKTMNDFCGRHMVTNQELVALFEYGKFAALHDTHSARVTNDGR